MIEKRWYTRNGVPMEEIKETRGSIVCSLANEFIEATDTEITESEYNALREDIEAEIAQARVDAIAAFGARQAEIMAQKAAAKAKLMAGNPLTEEEADVVLLTMP